jgi:hypothetical protein
MRGRLASLRDRPVSKDERRAATVAVLAFVLGVFLLFSVTRVPPSEQAQRSVQAHPVAPTTPAQTPPATASELRIADGFLSGYLAYVYGGAPAGKTSDATRALIASLEDHPPRVHVNAHTRLPTVLALRPSGQLAVTAVLNDGGIVNYTLGLRLTRLHRGLVVAGLERQ